MTDLRLEILDLFGCWGTVPMAASHGCLPSKLHGRFEAGDFGSFWLLGDSAYGCKPWLLTKVRFMTDLRLEILGLFGCWGTVPIAASHGCLPPRHTSTWGRTYSMLQVTLLLFC